MIIYGGLINLKKLCTFYFQFPKPTTFLEKMINIHE